MDYLHLVATEVNQWCTENQPTDGAHRSRFHSSRIPPVAVSDYYRRIVKYSQCSPEVLLLSLIFMRRYSEKMSIPVTFRNAHRLMIVSTLVAAKLHDDIFFSNSYYAAIGGLPVKEMTDLEMDFLVSLEFVTAVSVEEFADVEKSLVERFGASNKPLPPAAS